MAYVIEVNKRDVSRYAEKCEHEGQDDHECDEMCRYLDGDVRVIRDHGQSDYEYDDSDAEDHGTPVRWAIDYLGGHHFPDLYKPSIRGGKVSECEWLSANDPDPYRDQETEYSIYLRGDWTPEERAQVFEAVGS
ncbi:hypothetical protein ACFW2V_13425 [Streptomyces sp. NPDC058947]|uniref:hypothetical protein n=1 Tax=Streptomyces sp. NPDC058947 TaxID=3346675 RepID=UPI0036809EC5